MEINHKELLNEVFSEVAEKLAFMFSDMPDEDEFSDIQSDSIKASMAFAGPFTGSIDIVVTEEMCSEIAANVLGLDFDDELLTENAANDALKELLNVTCGHVLTSIAGEEPVFDLTIPEIASLNEEQWKEMRDDPTTCALLVDDNPVILRLSLDD